MWPQYKGLMGIGSGKDIPTLSTYCTSSYLYSFNGWLLSTSGHSKVERSSLREYLSSAYVVYLRYSLPISSTQSNKILNPLSHSSGLTSILLLVPFHSVFPSAEFKISTLYLLDVYFCPMLAQMCKSVPLLCMQWYIQGLYKQTRRMVREIYMATCKWLKVEYMLSLFVLLCLHEVGLILKFSYLVIFDAITIKFLISESCLSTSRQIFLYFIMQSSWPLCYFFDSRLIFLYPKVHKWAFSWIWTVTSASPF